MSLREEVGASSFATTSAVGASVLVSVVLAVSVSAGVVCVVVVVDELLEPEPVLTGGGAGVPQAVNKRTDKTNGAIARWIGLILICQRHNITSSYSSIVVGVFTEPPKN